MIAVDQYISRGIASDDMNLEAQQEAFQNSYDERLSEEAKQERTEYELWEEECLLETSL